ncbi:MAG: glycolate oxidase subunit GlcE [Thioalkalispiraceae bacterium]|jgi:glycolate oxidase FAD binding subunit
MSDQSLALQKRVKEHIDRGQAMQITAGNSKRFYANQIHGEELSVKEHSGIVHYEPTELVITARCGTPLQEIESALAEQNQMLAFEPPCFRPEATLGGCLATGLSGPRRPFTGAARDFTLGMRIINGQGEIMKFGGEVMKNVAGYDVSRLLVGSMGTLAIILEASLKVLPKPEMEVTIYYELTERAALTRSNELCAQNLPVSATCYDGKQLYIRLSGTESGVNKALRTLGGERINNADTFWDSIKNQSHEFFNHKQRLWRLSLNSSAPPLELMGDQLIEWRGAQRWLISEQAPEIVREVVSQHGGHATIFKNAQAGDEVFQPIYGKLHELHLNLKLAMDPQCLFNQSRMYDGF